MVQAKDIMTKDVISVRKNTPILEAIELLLKNEITGMPVVEKDMTLVGIISEKDALPLFHTYQNAGNKMVEHFMTRPAIHYNENDSLQTIVDFMLINYFRRIPVTSKKGKVVGIISRPDVLEYIFQQSRQTVPVS